MPAQVFRFIRPGFQRIAIESVAPHVRVLALANSERIQVTIAGTNVA